MQYSENIHSVQQHEQWMSEHFSNTPPTGMEITNIEAPLGGSMLPAPLYFTLCYDSVLFVSFRSFLPIFTALFHLSLLSAPF